MKALRLLIQPREPLLLGSGATLGNYRESLGYIPGGMLRGALARTQLVAAGAFRAYGIPGGQGGELFTAQFLDSSSPRFGAFWPVSTDKEGKIDPRTRSLPAPQTAYRCKEDTRHPIFDALHQRQTRSGEPLVCPECSGRVDRLKSVLQVDPDLAEARVATRLFVRVGLNRATETAAEGILYTVQGVSPFRTAFVGSLRRVEGGPDPRDLLPGDEFEVYLGGARSRGFGRCSIRTLGPGPLPPAGERIRALREAFEDDDLLVATLLSPGLFRDRWGRPATTLHPHLLSALAPELDGRLELVAAYARSETVRGWSQAWRLPKPIAQATSAGSVFCYRVRGVNEESLAAAVDRLEAHGVGERTREGFGEVVFCDPFHYRNAAKTGGNS